MMQPPTKGFLGSSGPRRMVNVCDVTERCDNIIKSQQDKREYRGLVLSNRMKVLVVSDPTTETSAAALDVNIGFLSDPDELPGLAHFCEHMLFLGTEKYPEENYYGVFLSEHGGYANASTFPDHTTFYFDVQPNFLKGVLDIFAQFFISPLFTESATSRELNAVNSEHENNVSSDTWRLDQLRRSIADPTHPFHKFGTGNRDTLETTPKAKGIDVRKELLNFHQKWYSSNIMTLIVLGKETLEELETMVVELFSGVEDRSVMAPSWPDHPFPPELLRRKVYCVPVKDLRSLTIEFPVPDTRKYYKSSPASHLACLVAHDGPGSLLSALKSRNWCRNLSVATGFDARGFGFFEVNVELTEDGLNHIDDIITFVFQYLTLLRKEGPQLWLWEEQRDLRAMEFKFKDIQNPACLVRDNVHLLQEIPLEDILSATYLLTHWRPELVEETLSLMTPENLRIMIVGKCFSEKCTHTEPWYGIKYHEEEIEDSLIQKWKSVQPIPELRLPPVNEFIPSNFDLETSEDPTSDSLAPVIIKDTPLMRLWYKKDNEFLLPKAEIQVNVISPLANCDPCSSNLTSVWARLLHDRLQHSAYGTGQAGLEWNISKNDQGLFISIGGFDNKQHVLLKKIVDKIVNFKTDPQRFKVIKEVHIREMKNHDAEQPYDQVIDLVEECLSDSFWTTSQLLEGAKGGYIIMHIVGRTNLEFFYIPQKKGHTLLDMTVQQLDDFVSRMVKNIYVEGLAYGNLTRARALQMFDIIESRMLRGVTPLYAQQMLLDREIEIEKGAWYLRETQNNVHRSSCACVYYACGVRDSRQNVMLKLLVNVLSEPCFNVLRTKEQLGYMVTSRIRVSTGVQGLKMLVQHNHHHPAYVETRIEAFIDSFLGYLEDMSEEKFLKHRSALAAQILEKPKLMYGKAMRIWGEIICQEYNFNRDIVDVDQLKTITKDELIGFYKKYISASSAERRKLSIRVVSTAAGGAGSDQDSNIPEPREGHDKQPTKITNLVEFKAGRRLYPLPIPCIKIPPKGAASCKL